MHLEFPAGGALRSALARLQDTGATLVELEAAGGEVSLRAIREELGALNAAVQVRLKVGHGGTLHAPGRALVALAPLAAGLGVLEGEAELRLKSGRLLLGGRAEGGQRAVRRELPLRVVDWPSLPGPGPEAPSLEGVAGKELLERLEALTHCLVPQESLDREWLRHIMLERDPAEPGGTQALAGAANRQGLLQAVLKDVKLERFERGRGYCLPREAVAGMRLAEGRPFTLVWGNVLHLKAGDLELIHPLPVEEPPSLVRLAVPALGACPKVVWQGMEPKAVLEALGEVTAGLKAEEKAVRFEIQAGQAQLFTREADGPSAEVEISQPELIAGPAAFATGLGPLRAMLKGLAGLCSEAALLYEDRHKPVRLEAEGIRGLVMPRLDGAEVAPAPSAPATALAA